MKLKGNLLILCCLLSALTYGQLGAEKTTFDHEDTLRGSLNQNRTWWNVLHYTLSVTPDIQSKTIKGSNTIRFSRVGTAGRYMQIDLQQPLVVDSITTLQTAPGNGISNTATTRFSFTRDKNVCLVDATGLVADSITIYYHGTPKEAQRAPWDGGLVWKQDKHGNSFVATACQGLGASAWWPCKDHQSDEPEHGMNINITAPDTLSAVSNGRLVQVSSSIKGNKTWSWQVKNPVNSYGITMNIGKYTNWSDTLMGEAGKLDMSFWALEENAEKARLQFAQAHTMLHCFEYWFGKYPFYEDSYKLVETPFLGMEHQSAVAYGNGFRNGYLGRDLSGSGWGLKWDFIIIHESGHEWFGNNITTKDIADMWVHEGFTNYSETLFTEWTEGKEAGNDYNVGIRKNILNDKPITGIYGVNEEGSSDMYYKAANMIHIIRQVMNDAAKFRLLLRSLNSTYYHQTVAAEQVKQLINRESGFDFSKTFEQYLHTTQIPSLDYYFSTDSTKIYYRWSNCIEGFNMPLRLGEGNNVVRLKPTTNWQNLPIKKSQSTLLLPAQVKRLYYIAVQQLTAKP